jgi:hypothetical protein
VPDAAPSSANTRADPLPSEDELRPKTDETTGLDLSLIEENLKLTPWERILANDDTVNLCDTARAALRNQNAEAARTAREVDRG